MVDVFKFSEEDEKILVGIALKLDPAVRDIMRNFRMGCIPLENLLDRLSVKPEDVEGIEDIVDIDELDNVLPGEEQYRDYSKIRTLAAATVMLAETIAIAKDARGYEFRFLSDDERKDAKMEVEMFASYKGLFSKMQSRQGKAMRELRKMSGRTADAVMERIRRMGISQEPIAVFELPADQRFDFLRHRRDMPRHYLCMISDGRTGVLRASHLHLFSKNNQLPLRESYYFNPGANQEDHYEVEEHFGC